jgi:hypothetical protein
MAEPMKADEMRAEASRLLVRAKDNGAAGWEQSLAMTAYFMEAQAVALIEIREELTALREAVTPPSDYREMTPDQAARFQKNLDAFIAGKREQEPGQ